MTRICLLVTVCLLLSAPVSAPGQPLSMAVPTDVLRDYRRLYPQDIRAVDNLRYDHPGNRRDVVEVALVQRALYLGGISQMPTMVEQDDYLRILQQLAAGRLLLTGTSVWDFDARELVEQLWVSSPLIRRGEFVAGLYTRSDHPLARLSPTLEQLRHYRVVTSRNWKMDWSLLEQLGFHQVLYANSWASQARMVLAGRADLVLAPFPVSSDLRIPLDGGNFLLPVPGIKVAFPAERALAVSKSHKDGQAVFRALQRGLQQLRKTGEIERAYREAGFFNPYVADWTLLNP